MLSAQILNSSASLNDFDIIGSIQFIPGAPFTLVLRLTQPQRDDELRYVADSGASLTLTLTQKDGTTLDLTASEFTDDRSIWSVSVTALQSDELASGNLIFTLNEGGAITKGWVENGLQLVSTGGC